MTRKGLLLGVLFAAALGALILWPLQKAAFRSPSPAAVSSVAKTVAGPRTPAFAFSFSSPEGAQALGNPLAVIAFSSEVFVSDAHNGRIAVYSRDGWFIRTLGDDGQNPGKLRYPYGLTMHEQKLFIADMGAAAIRVYEPTGKFLEDLTGPGLLSKPTDVKIRGARVYVADVGRHQVLVLDREGKLIQAIGGPGEENGAFRFPNGIALGEDGTLYVADSGNNRVQVFDQAGNFLRAVGSESNPLTAARGIFVDGAGRLFVVAGLLNQVVAFAPDGKELYRLGGRGGGPQSLFLPNGIYVAQDGTLYVTEAGNRRVSVFK